MNAAFHIDATKTIAKFLGWGGHQNLLAKSAAYPDSVEAVEVEGLGLHYLGHNFAAFTHFCRPVGDGLFRGYCYGRDPSTPHFDFPLRKVISHPTAWIIGAGGVGSAIGPHEWEQEPLTRLLRTLEGHGSTGVEDITFPTAAVMAEWVWGVSTMVDRGLRTDVLVGYVAHFVQDCCVPHHAMGALLLGHSSFEALIGDLWRKWSVDGTAQVLIDKAREQPIDPAKSVRTLCEEAATASVIAARRAWLYETVYPWGWKVVAEESIRRAIAATVTVLRKADPALG